MTDLPSKEKQGMSMPLGATRSQCPECRYTYGTHAPTCSRKEALTSKQEPSWTDPEPLKFARDLANAALATSSEHVHIRADFLLALLDKLHGSADETSGDVRVEQPEPFATVYVFGVKRPIDSEPWYLAFTNQEHANRYPHRCTKVTAVLLYPPVQMSESQSQ